MLASIFSINVLQSALELGCIRGVVGACVLWGHSMCTIPARSPAVFVPLGCAACGRVGGAGHPVLALFAAMAAGVLSGFITAFLQTRLGVESIMAGIIVNTGLYTINLAVMGFSSNMSLVRVDTVFSLGKDLLAFAGGWYQLLLVAAVILIACVLMVRFLGTRLGLSIRATGDNAAMVRASSIDPGYTIMVGLCISGSLTALSGALLAQYQKSCDINVGTGMVTIALASLIIGETLLGKRSMILRVSGVVFGSCLYRFIVAVALRVNVPAAAMKLVSALIVAGAISMPAIPQKIALEKRKQEARPRHPPTHGKKEGGWSRSWERKGAARPSTPAPRKKRGRWTASTWPWKRAISPPSWAPTARANPPCSTPSPAASSPTRAASSWAGRTSPSPPSSGAAR